MQVQFNTVQSNYNPQFTSLTKFNHAEIKNGLKVTKWVDGIIGAETGLKDLAKDVNIAVSITPNDKHLDLRFVDYIISEIGGTQREVSESFCPYVRDNIGSTTEILTNKFLSHIKEAVEKFKAVTALKEY